MQYTLLVIWFILSPAIFGIVWRTLLDAKNKTVAGCDLRQYGIPFTLQDVLVNFCVSAILVIGWAGFLAFAIAVAMSPD